jgi:nitric-oxide synthase, brain
MLMVIQQKNFKDNAAYEAWKSNYPNLAETLKMFPSVNPDLAALMAKLPKMKSRFYSISSSEADANGQVNLTIASIKFNLPTQNALHYGVCSNWIEEATIGTIVPCCVRS